MPGMPDARGLPKSYSRPLIAGSGYSRLLPQHVSRSGISGGRLAVFGMRMLNGATKKCAQQVRCRSGRVWQNPAMNHRTSSLNTTTNYTWKSQHWVGNTGGYKPWAVGLINGPGTSGGEGCLCRYKRVTHSPPWLSSLIITAIYRHNNNPCRKINPPTSASFWRGFK